ncbi:hypothetical protein M2146_002511 [Lachnospiraceae bacterium PF1-22]
MICGFLSPKGKFIKCEPHDHLYIARKLVSKVYRVKVQRSSDAEEYLLQLGYVIYSARGVRKSWMSNDGSGKILLTDVQKTFVINNICNANNKDQEDSIMELLKWDDDLREDSILSRKRAEVLW